MVNLTISLPEETVRRLRKVVAEKHGSRRGAISGIIDEALRDAFDRLETPAPSQVFRAVKGDETVAEGESLVQLASRLKSLGVDPRAVRILSSNQLRHVAKAGFRARRA